MAAASAAVDMVAADTEEAVMGANRRLRENAMLQTIENRLSTTGCMATWILSLIVVLALGIAPASFAQESGQKTFSSAAEASDAFAAAVQNHDEAAMLAILGPSSNDLISSGDPVADRNHQDIFTAKYR